MIFNYKTVQMVKLIGSLKISYIPLNLVIFGKNKTHVKSINLNLNSILDLGYHMNKYGIVLQNTTKFSSYVAFITDFGTELYVKDIDIAKLRHALAQ